MLNMIIRELKLTSLIKASFLDFLASSDAAWGGMTTSSMLLVTSGTDILEDKRKKKRMSVTDFNAREIASIVRKLDRD